MNEINLYLAQQLKALRKANGWSLDRTSSETGVSKAMLGQIERGESSPTVATLWKISGGFNTSLTNFLEPPLKETKGTIVRSASSLRNRPGNDGMLVAPLFPYEKRFGFELFELTLLPGYERLSEPHKKGMTEHVIVLSGKMELLVNNEWIEVTPGVGVRFAADQPHGYRNSTDEATIIHNLMHYA